MSYSSQLDEINQKIEEYNLSDCIDIDYERSLELTQEILVDYLTRCVFGDNVSILKKVEVNEM